MKKTIAISFLILIGAIAYATDGPGITVVLKITEPKYVLRYAPLEKTIAREIADVLKANFPVFDFKSDRTFQDTIYIAICRKEGETNKYFFIVNMTLRISGKNTDPDHKKLEWVFAENGKFSQYLVSEKEFVQKVRGKFISLLNDENKKAFMDALLKKRFITENVDSIKIDWSDKQWTFVYTFSELKIGSESQFQVLQLHKEGSHEMGRRYVIEVKNKAVGNAKILAELKPQLTSTEDLQRLKEGTFRKIEYLRIIDVKPFAGDSPVNPLNSGI
jgi:hypothetical protein